MGIILISSCQLVGGMSFGVHLSLSNKISHKNDKLLCLTRRLKVGNLRLQCHFRRQMKELERAAYSSAVLSRSQPGRWGARAEIDWPRNWVGASSTKLSHWLSNLEDLSPGRSSSLRCGKGTAAGGSRLIMAASLWICFLLPSLPLSFLPSLHPFWQSLAL